MSTFETAEWLGLNQSYLNEAVARVRELLERHIDRSRDEAPPKIPDSGQLNRGMPETETRPGFSPALETLCQLFSLSAFERNILLLCVGMELDADFSLLCANIQQDNRRHSPTFSLAMAVFPEAHWSALSPAGPLRYWRMIETGHSENLTTAPLKIDERILHYLTGVQYIDERIAGFIRPVPPFADLVPSHRQLVSEAVNSWTRAAQERDMPVLQLYGADSASRCSIASGICAAMGLNLQSMSAPVIPTDTRELEALKRLWEREAALSHGTLLLDITDIDRNDHAREVALSRFIEGSRFPLILTGRERRAMTERASVNREVGKPTLDEQRTLWRQGLDGKNDDGQIESLVAQFNLNASTIRSVCTEVKNRLPDGNGDNKRDDILWDCCRIQIRPRLEELAQHITSVVLWDDLVLPETQQLLLREITAQVRQKIKVYETWGFGSRSTRGLGISALFTGASGTGKTMAAEVLANELRLDLYRIDLSQVVSKYIGETEKNLRRVFDAAEDGGSILLFDEADALFGKRGEVRDSHDRYANIEISYLLQRMESYRGLAILTTNMKEALDKAFLRRIRFVVEFPFPNTIQRAEIWRRIFPGETPTSGLDIEKLAQLNVAGGNIHNIALYAAFLAADAHEPVKMAHALRAAHVEYSKMEKTLTDAEIRGWT